MSPTRISSRRAPSSAIARISTRSAWGRSSTSKSGAQGVPRRRDDATRSAPVMVLACVAGVALAAARPARLAAKGLSEAELLKRIEKGGTAGDHEALAAYYGDQAKAAAKKASEHEAMADKYANVTGKTDWPTHCRSLGSYYRKLAEEYDAMAKLHGEHAAELREKK